MGWSGGARVGNEIWESIRPLIRPEFRTEAARAIVNTLISQGWDNYPEAPLLSVESGMWELGAFYRFKCDSCSFKAVWRGVVDNRPTVACNRCVPYLEFPEILS